MQNLGKILKTVLIVAIISVVALLAVNMYKSSYKALEDAIVTSDFKQAYAVSQEVMTHDPADKGFSENGGLYAYSLAYIEKSGYVQITVRYNDRHMDDVAKEYPTFNPRNIYYTITDSNGVTYNSRIIESESKFHYNYAKIEFTGVDFTADKLVLNMVIDELSAVIGSDNSVVLHKRGEDCIPFELSESNLNELTK